MLKAVFGLFLSIMFGFVTVAQAQTAPQATTSSSAKKIVKKSAASKRKAKTAKAAPKRKAKVAAKSKRQARNTVRGKRKAANLHAKNTRNTKGRLVKKVVLVHGKRKVVYQRVAVRPAPVAAAVASAGDMAGLNRTRDPLALKSNVALVFDQNSAKVLLEKNADVPLPIASITKLMTATVVLDAHQDMNEVLEVTTDDIDHEKNTTSRLRIGSRLRRADMLHIALMSSENRAASALGRYYPGGRPAFVAAMNAKAKALGMTHTHYVDTNGLSSLNVASATDLAKLVVVASRQPVIRKYSTDTQYVVDTGGHILQYANTNRLVKNPEWDISLQKTGYINEAGRCLVMQAKVKGRPIVMVFLDSKGKLTRLADATRVRKWLTGNGLHTAHKSQAAIPQS